MKLLILKLFVGILEEKEFIGKSDRLFLSKRDQELITTIFRKEYVFSQRGYQNIYWILWELKEKEL